MPPISIMVKPASSLCNLKCKYCFYRDVSKHRKQAESGFMPMDVAEALIKKSLAFANGCDVSFVFQGGEPTLIGIDYYKSFVSLVKKLNFKNSRVYFSLQTNAVLINDEWAQFFKKNNFLIGVSLDGDFDSNALRKTENGLNSFNSVMNSIEIFKKYNVEFNVVSVITAENAEKGEAVYNFLKSNGFKYLQFIPCIRSFDLKEGESLCMSNEQYAEFLIKMFTLYVNDYASGNYISVRQFDNWVRLFLRQPAEQCGAAGYCTRQLVCESNGSMYPCDFYCLDEYFLGNIMTDDFKEIAESAIVKKFIEESSDVPDKCKKCDVYRLCRAGGCKRNRLSEDYCEAYKKFFHSCLPLFKKFI